jgi:hypothetical protein
MIQLPLMKTKNGCFYNQVHRSANAAIYSLRYSPSKSIVGYEVFKITVSKPWTLPDGTVIPEQEHFPSNEEIGGIGFSYDTIKSAMKKFEELDGSHEPRKEGQSCLPCQP